MRRMIAGGWVAARLSQTGCTGKNRKWRRAGQASVEGWERATQKKIRGSRLGHAGKEEKEKVSGLSWATAMEKRLGQRRIQPMHNRRTRKAFINF
jgi:hypothetical protein